MFEKLNAYLNAPIPRKKAFVAIAAQAVAHYTTTVYATRRVVMVMKDALANQAEVIEILTETNYFLLDHAEDSVAAELNEKLDYWRIIRGVEPREK